MSILDTQAGKLADTIRSRFEKSYKGLKAYFSRLLFPIYFFPIKLITYTSYYVGKFSIQFTLSLIIIFFETIIFPFRSLKNFLKSLFILGFLVYMFASLFVIGDYLNKEYGAWGKFLCSYGVRDTLKSSVVRIVGGYSEGSGFFIDEDQILTNFHVIADEPSPKIIFPNGDFVTPYKILGDKDADLALLFIKKHFPDLVLKLPDELGFYVEEPLLAVGYPLGTDLVGNATVTRGNFIDFRRSSRSPVGYIQTNISLVPGMSGGPIADQCGRVVGINTQGLAGISLFIMGSDAKELIPYFTDQEVKKLEVDPSLSPKDAVTAFYTYLKARRMEDGFDLLSKQYLKKTDFEEWTSRFSDILDVDVILSETYKDTDDTVFVKFSTKNWNNDEVDYHYYEGTWQTVHEDGVYKMLKSNIAEVDEPSWRWFFQ